MSFYVELKDLYDCNTCFHFREGSGMCTTFCDSGESYRPAFNKLKVYELKNNKLYPVRDKSKVFKDIPVPICKSCNRILDRVSVYCKYCGEKILK